MKRTAMPTHRTRPRRKAPERVRQERQKPKAGAAPTAAESRHMDRVAQMDCLVAQRLGLADSQCAGRVTLHHPTGSIHGGRLTRTHKYVTPICERHHQIQPGPRESVEALGHAGFYVTYGIDLYAEGNRLWSESCDLLGI